MKKFAFVLFISVFVFSAQAEARVVSPIKKCREYRRACMAVIDNGGQFLQTFNDREFYVLGPIDFTTYRRRARRECRRMTRNCRRHYRAVNRAARQFAANDSLDESVASLEDMSREGTVGIPSSDSISNSNRGSSSAKSEGVSAIQLHDRGSHQ